MSPSSSSDPSTQESRRVWLFDTLAKSVSLSVVLLPVAGVIVRVVAFRFAGVGSPTRLAVSASIPLLAATGFWTVVTSVSFVLVLLATREGEMTATDLRSIRRDLGLATNATDDFSRKLASLGERLRALVPRVRSYPNDANAIPPLLNRELQAVLGESQALEDILARVEGQRIEDFRAIDQSLDALKSRPFRRFQGWITSHIPKRRAMVVLLWSSFPALLLFMPGWPSSMFPLFAVPLVIVTTQRLSARGDYSFSRLWPAFMLIGLLTAIYAGLAGVTPGVDVGRYTFTDTTLRDGIYLEVGAAGDRLLLMPCEDDANGILSVRSADTLAVKYGKAVFQFESSLFQILFHDARPSIGINGVCPT